MLGSGCVVRGAPRQQPLVRGWGHRHQGRGPSLFLASPPHARRPVRRPPTAQRRLPLPSADVRLVVGWHDGARRAYQSGWGDQLAVRSTPQVFLASSAIRLAASVTSLLLRDCSFGASDWSFEGSTPLGIWPLWRDARSLGLRPASLRADSMVVKAPSRVFQSAETLSGALSASVCIFEKTWSRLLRSALLPLRPAKKALSDFSSSQ